MIFQNEAEILKCKYEHILRVLEIGDKSKERLEKNGITNFEDLKAAKEKLRCNGLDGVREHIQLDLLDAICWCEENATRGGETDFFKEFNDTVWEEFQKSQNEDRESKKDERMSQIKKEWEAKRDDEDDLIDQYIVAMGHNNPNIYDAFEQDTDLYDRLRENVTRKVMTDHLKQECGNFQYEPFILDIIQRFHELTGQNLDLHYLSQFIVAGRTQSGKSAVKAVVHNFCQYIEIPLVIITKSVSGANDLTAKLIRLTRKDHKFSCNRHGKDDLNQNILSAASNGEYWKTKREKLSKAISRHQTIVAADTPAQINRVAGAIKDKSDHVPFVLIVDECDAMLRTGDKSQKVEQALDALMNLKPALTIMISATIIPTIVDSLDSAYDQEPKMYKIEPHEDYIGLNEMLPFKDGEEEVYLEQNELRLNSSDKDSSKPIPYWNSKVQKFYDEALRGESKGVLILDVTNPRVNVQGNVYVKAEMVQDMYFRKSIGIIVVVITGRGISVKHPIREWKERKDELMGSVLNSIDKEYGLHWPIVVFGFSLMTRGISFRSDKRVPTHMVMSLGRGHNAMNMIQTMGRATFNGRSVLKQNGFTDVKLLTTKNDFITAKKAQPYVDEVIRRFYEGSTFKEAVTGTKEEFKDDVNFLRHTFREIGRLRGQRKIVDEFNFKAITGEFTDDEKGIIKEYQDDKDAHCMLRAILDLSIKHATIVVGDIHDAYRSWYENWINNHYMKRKQMTKKSINEYIRAFKDKCIISKTDKDTLKVSSNRRLCEILIDMVEEDDENDELKDELKALLENELTVKESVNQNEHLRCESICVDGSASANNEVRFDRDAPSDISEVEEYPNNNDSYNRNLGMVRQKIFV